MTLKCNICYNGIVERMLGKLAVLNKNLNTKFIMLTNSIKHTEVA